jgi:arginyl-tRNA synthetase
VLSFSGADIEREFYINDSRESNQIKELGKTALGVGEQYKTPQLEKMMEEMDFNSFNAAEAGFTLAEMVQEYNKNFIETKLGIKFDNWYSEDENIRATGVADKILEELDNKNLTYKEDGAVWVKTSNYGDSEDRVVVRSDGTKSYFVSDIAYHEDKFGRGYDKVLDVWGADHHGHVKRMHAVGKILGWPMEPQPQPIIFITQLVSLKEGGERKKMSKRAGTAIPLEDLVDNFGLDVVRWFFSEKSLGTHMDFDADLAKEQSSKNPVYYVQYAHARIHSILEKTKEFKSDGSSLVDTLKTERGRALAMKITEFSEVVEDIAGDFGVHKLTTYAHELAGEFSQFYRDVRIVEDDTYNKGALELALTAKNTLARALDLLGISAPEKM